MFWVVRSSLGEENCYGRKKFLKAVRITLGQRECVNCSEKFLRADRISLGGKNFLGQRDSLGQFEDPYGRENFFRRVRITLPQKVNPKFRENLCREEKIRLGQFEII
jgi:hypothetical protein